MTKQTAVNDQDSEGSPARKAKVAYEVAELEFEKFCAFWELDVDPEHMDDDDLKAYNKTKRLISRAITMGRCVVEDSGELVYTTTYSKDTGQVHFSMPDGSVIQASDSGKDGYNVKRMIQVLCAATKLPPIRFQRMDSRDFNFCQAVIGLFLG